MFKVFHPLQVGRNHTSDGAAISGTIRMTPDIFVNGAGIQAGSATDAIETFSLLWIFQQEKRISRVEDSSSKHSSKRDQNL